MTIMVFYTRDIEVFQFNYYCFQVPKKYIMDYASFVPKLTIKKNENIMRTEAIYESIDVIKIYFSIKSKNTYSSMSYFSLRSL